MSGVREKIIMRVSLAENEVKQMSEMPNLQIWNTSHAYLRNEENQVRLSVRTYIKNIDDDYTNSTAIAEASVIFSVESFTEYVADITKQLERVKAELAELTEVA
jgi:hypothetical protein